MKIAALQMVSGTDVAENCATARRLVAEAADRGAALVALPEYFCLMGRSDRDKLAIAEAPGDGPIQRMLSEAAREHGVWLIGGTLPISCRTSRERGVERGTEPSTERRKGADPERVLNACCVYAPTGQLAVRYDKIHLFRYDNGRERYDEGCTILAGREPVAFDATTPRVSDRDRGRPGDEHADKESIRVGLSVCYDLRFPELYRALMTPPCELLSVPAAFTHTTGLAHWELLLRARAVENQCYVLAAAQGGLHENGRRTYGHSMVVDPWGTVLDVLPEGTGIAMAEIDLARIASVRQQLPALDHRRMPDRF